jgi:hypothetical protein
MLSANFVKTKNNDKIIILLSWCQRLLEVIQLTVNMCKYLFRTYSCCWGAKSTTPYIFHNAMDVSLVLWVKLVATDILSNNSFDPDKEFQFMSALFVLILHISQWNMIKMINIVAKKCYSLACLFFSLAFIYQLNLGLLLWIINIWLVFSGLLVNSPTLYPVLSNNLDIEW